MSRSVRHRALVRAARAWEAGKPHQAWCELDQAGCGELWIEFRDEALRRARTRYRSRIRAVTQS